MNLEIKKKNKVPLLLISIVLLLLTLAFATSIYIVLNSTPKLKAESLTANEINISWSAVKNAQLYNIYRMDEDTGEYKKISTAKTNSFTDDDLKPKSNYWYKITVIKNGKEGRLSSPVKETTKCLPSTPNDISTEVVSFDKIDIKWTSSNNVEKYNIYRADSDKSEFKKISESKDTTYNDSKLRPTTTYKYKVTSVNKNGESEFSTIVEATTKEKINERGNTGNNLVNNGLAADQGDWVYFSGKSRGSSSLYKVKKDGSSAKKLFDGGIDMINVIGDWIYFSNGGTYCKIKTDGSSYTEIRKECFDPCIIGDWVYYSLYEGIYKMKTDGSENTLIVADNSSCFNVEGDWIYYSNISDKNSLYKVKTDGNSKTKLVAASTGFINISNDWIYYRDYYDNQKIYKIKMDGTCRTKVSDDTVNYFNVIGDWIIYENWGISGTIYKMKVDGTNKVQLTATHYNSVNIITNYIFCYNFDTCLLHLVPLNPENLDLNNNDLNSQLLT